MAKYWLSEAMTAVGSLDSAELFNPATGKFTPTGSMQHLRGSVTATTLKKGKVLVVGEGSNLYYPDKGIFSPTNGRMLTLRTDQTATLMTFGSQAGDVLIAGGTDGSGNALASAELYNPTSGDFILINSMKTARAFAAAGELQ